MNIGHTIFELIFSATLFVKGALFSPQIWRIWQRKDVSALSITTFGSMNVMQILMIVHAFLRCDLVLMSGIIFSFITSGIVSISIIYYRWFYKSNS